MGMYMYTPFLCTVRSSEWQHPQSARHQRPPYAVDAQTPARRSCYSDLYQRAVWRAPHKSRRMQYCRLQDPSTWIATTQEDSVQELVATVEEEEYASTSSNETKSSSCSRSATPNSAFSALLNRPVSSIVSIRAMDLTRCSEHLGSAASRIMSMYSQFESAACVTAG